MSDAQPFDLRIAVETTVNIDARSARRSVTGWLIDEVGNMLIGGQPQLIIGQKTVWRVPVTLTSSSGAVNEVGTVDVDAATGKLNISKKRKQILDNVKQIVGSTSPAIG